LLSAVAATALIEELLARLLPHRWRLPALDAGDLRSRAQTAAPVGGALAARAYVMTGLITS